MTKQWIKLFGSIEEAHRLFPLNTVKTIKIGEKRICFGRLIDGFFAIDDLCPHLGASLGMGECQPSGYVKCPWHHYLFDLRTGRDIGDHESNVKSFLIKAEKTGIFIDLQSS